MARSRYYQKVAIESYLAGAQGEPRSEEEIRDDLNLEGVYLDDYLDFLAGQDEYGENSNGYYFDSEFDEDPVSEEELEVSEEETEKDNE